MAGRLVAGLDVSSTAIKLLVAGEDGDEVSSAPVPTPWRSGPRGTADMTPQIVQQAVADLFAASAARLRWLNLPEFRAPTLGARTVPGAVADLADPHADGPLPADRYHVSPGTAEVLLRVINAPLGAAGGDLIAAAPAAGDHDRPEE